MPYIDPNVILQAKQIDLLTYLQAYEPLELIRLSSHVYALKSHDSLKISNGKWFWWSHGFGGYSALDFLIKVRGMNFVDAVAMLQGQAAIKPPSYVKKEEPVKELVFPLKSSSTERVEKYLQGRGIHKSIITYCIKSGKLYESKDYHNAVFVGCDSKETSKYGAIRGTSSKRFLGEVPGSDKHYSFSVSSSTESDMVRLFESAIDLLSFATIELLENRNWRSKNLLSLAGIYKPFKNGDDITLPMALEQYLSNHSSIKKITLHLDNDNAGRLSAKALQEALSKRYEVINEPPTQGKDFNDQLCIQLGIYKPELEVKER